MKDLSIKIRLFVFLSFVVLWNAVTAQTMSVDSFRLLETDMTANTYGTTERDQNGEVAALIKVVTSETGFVFDGGMMGIVKTVQKTGEIWVYVPYGLQKITISHQQLGILRDYYFPVSIEKARTYELKLTTGTVRTIVEQTTTSQFVLFKVSPQNAVVFIDDDDPRSLDSDGMLSVRLNKGTHSYRITATSYISESGAFEVQSEKITKEISLKSAKASLMVNTEQDAEIWINDKKMGTGSWTGSLEAGIYLVETRKPSHRSIKEEITLGQQEQRNLTMAAPIPIYGTLEISSSPLESDVLIDGVPSGQTPLLIEKVLVGNHDLTVRKKGYVDQKVNIKIEENATCSQSITLKAEDPHQYVDLGLSVKWATTNVDASAPEESGGYYAWGEIETKASYSSDNYKYYTNGKTPTKYVNSDKTPVLAPEDDVASVKWGGDWRMPTKQEWEELFNNCDVEWTTQNGVPGRKFTSKKVRYLQNSIFIPAVGEKYKEINRSEGMGRYWTSSSAPKDNSRSSYVTFGSGGFGVFDESRETGRPVRPVCP